MRLPLILPVNIVLMSVRMQLQLKSFGSQAGCGEIFADDLVSPEGVLSLERHKDACEYPKQSPTTAGFQGGTEMSGLFQLTLRSWTCLGCGKP